MIPIRSLLSVALLAFAAGCAHFPDKIDRDKFPPFTGVNPFGRLQHVYIEDADLSAATIHGMTVEAYAATLKPKQAESLREDVRAIGTEFRRLLTTASDHPHQYNPPFADVVPEKQADGWVVKLHVREVELGDGWSTMGFNTSNKKATLHGRIEITSPAGKTDSLEDQSEAAGGYGSGDRLRALGILAAGHLRAQWLSLRARGHD